MSEVPLYTQSSNPHSVLTPAAPASLPVTRGGVGSYFIKIHELRDRVVWVPRYPGKGLDNADVWRVSWALIQPLT